MSENFKHDMRKVLDQILRDEKCLLYCPQDFPNTMTDIDYDTWMLSGSAVMRDGQTVRNGYCCDLDTLSVGSRGAIQ